MTPRDSGIGASLGDDAREYRVAHEAIGLVELTGIDVWLTRITSRVDQESGLFATEEFSQGSLIGVIEVGTPKIAKRNALALEERLISRTHITGTAEQIDHR